MQKTPWWIGPTVVLVALGSAWQVSDALRNGKPLEAGLSLLVTFLAALGGFFAGRIARLMR